MGVGDQSALEGQQGKPPALYPISRSMKPQKLTPMMQQYLLIKEAHPDAILFFRMGDFYEMFFEDAQEASKILEITLTSRNKNDAGAVPMCGVPVKAAPVYIGRLLGHGKKVAVCDQLEDPASAKGLVKRDVVRVITPGMIIESEYLDEKTENYLLALGETDGLYGIASLDLSTGRFRVTEIKGVEPAKDEILRIAPTEVLLPNADQKESGSPGFRPFQRVLENRSVTYLEDRLFDPVRGKERLTEQFKTLTLEGFGAGHLRAGLGAAGALLHYVRETQKQSVGHITRLEPYAYSDSLVIDDLSCRNLELTKNLWDGSRNGTLLHILDHTVTAMGGRCLKRWLRYPSIDFDEIAHRLDAVEEAKKEIQATRRVRELLAQVADMERLGSRVVLGHANARDLIALKRALQLLPEILNLLAVFQSALFQFQGGTSTLQALAEGLESAIVEDPPPTLHEGGIIKKGYHQDLDELIQITQEGRAYLARLEAREREATGISSLKVRYNKVFGYYIEIPKTHAPAAPAHYVRKQTLVNAERYITDELKAFELKVFTAQEKRAALEYELFEAVRVQAAAQNPQIQAVAAFLACLDVLLALAETADRNQYVRPVLNRDGRLFIEEGRHPVVEKMIAGQRFVPNTVQMDNDQQQVLIITGPNMAGKSTLLRQAALLVLMTHMGSFVPAKSALIPLTDRIFTRVGALDNLSQGQSTFMVEMQETANILHHATDQSLVILDEIGRGTSTYDGLSIAWAVAEYLHDLNEKGVKTLFATHYHELTALSETKSRIRNFNVAVKEWNEEIIFLRKLVEGGTNRSYGIQVARLAGIPGKVIEKAKEILLKIENRPGAFLEAHPPQRGRPSQLSLFFDASSPVLERLKKIDVLHMTPVEALNCLSELKEMVEEEEHGGSKTGEGTSR